MHLRPQPTDMIGAFQKEEWLTRKIFMQRMSQICQEEHIELRWLSHDWLARLRKDDTVRWVMGNVFPLNSASSAAIAKDKVATYEALSAAGIPAVAHYLIRFPGNRATEQALAYIQAHYGFPLVLKPCNQGSGFDVYKVTTSESLAEILADMATRYQIVALSPLEEVRDEFRVVMLDGEPLLTFSKVRPTDSHGNTIEWRHNLHLGAEAKPVKSELKDAIISLATQVMTELQLRVCAIDIVATPEGLKVMEINNGFSLSKTSEFPDFTETSYQALKRIVQACFAT